ncbi:MAG: tetratricopeptide repeat protein [Bacteroidales bacterium]|nr:tetratricopeptide repeat protein [Bacteroidales bacterium]
MRAPLRTITSLALMGLAAIAALGQPPDSLLFDLHRQKSDSAKIALLLKVADFYSSEERNLQLANDYVLEAERLAEHTQQLLLRGNVYNQIGSYYRRQSQFSEARSYHNRALEIAHSLNDSLLMAQSHNGLGVVYRRVDNYAMATQHHMAALRIAERINYQHGVSVASNSLGNIFSANGQFDKALVYFNKGLEISIAQHNLRGMAINYNNIGEVYELKGDLERAGELYLKSLQLNKEIRNPQGISICYSCLGKVALREGNAATAFNHFRAALDIDKQQPDRQVLGSTYINLARASLSLRRPNEALRYTDQAMDIAHEVGSPLLLQQAHELHRDRHVQLGQYREAYPHTLQANRYRDSLINQTTSRTIASLQSLYEAEKHEQELSLLRQEQELHELRHARQRTTLYALLAAVAIMLGILGWIYTLLRNKRRTNQQLSAQISEIKRSNIKLAEQKEEIAAQKEDIINQKELIAQQNSSLKNAYRTIERHVQSMTDSLRYAERIQESMRPAIPAIRAAFADTMVVNLPKNIVSGDFYYMQVLPDGRVLFALADCTGHGVPGAFMSIIGTNMLGKGTQQGIVEPAQLLSFVHTELQQGPPPSSSNTVRLDSMDIAICLYAPQSRQLTYAGALIPIMVVNNGQLREIKPNTCSLGSDLRAEPTAFRAEHITLEPGTWVYISSDGLFDQIGGTKQQKFQRTRFKSIIAQMLDLDGSRQQQAIMQEFELWKGPNEQLDDVLVWGLKV